MGFAEIGHGMWDIDIKESKMQDSYKKEVGKQDLDPPPPPSRPCKNSAIHVISCRVTRMSTGLMLRIVNR